MRELDHGVGVILDELKKLNIQDNTLVFFSSDNGGATYAKERGNCFVYGEIVLFSWFNVLNLDLIKAYFKILLYAKDQSQH